MDSKEISTFKKTIDDLIKSENGDCMYQDVMLSFVKNKTDFPNMKILNELLPTQFPVIIAHKPFNKTPVQTVSEQNTFVTDNIPCDKPTKRPSRGSVDGSPLKMQVYANLSTFQTSSFDCTTTDVTIDSEEMKFGIPLAIARKLTGIYNVSSQKDAKNVITCPSFLCFCDGNDRKRAVCLYTDFLKSPKNEFVGLKSVLVHVMNTVDNDEHLPNLRKMDLSGKQIKCKATYDILNDQLGLKETCLYRGSLLLDVTWSRQHSNISFLHVPPPEATTTIKANVILGSMRSAVHGLYQELSVLKSLIEGLQSSQITWIPNEEGQIDMMTLLKGLFENLKLGDAASKIIFEERDNFDFTDHLWKILSKSTSFLELVDSFKYIFTALSNGELQPMVHRGNNTMVAQLVSDSYLRKLRIPDLAGIYPVELLVEMGIEKLRKDYTHAFLSKDLVTRENLEPFLKSEGEYNTHLIQLEKMHSVLEMISMLEFFLKIPDQNLSALAREMIQHYERNVTAENHIFEFIVPTNSVIKYLEGCPPSTWQLESAKLVENIKEATTFLLTSNPPFKHLTFKDTNMNTKEDENETNVDETRFCTTTDKMKRTYFYVKKTECVSILV